MAKHIGLYVHIPFCKRKCNYCDFYSFSNKNELIIDYMKCLIQEIEEVGQGIALDKENGLNDGAIINTIYIGGGTPSYIDSKYILNIMNSIKDNYILNKPEVTIEVNPGTVNENKLKEYINCGINRCSIGLQSSNNELLNLIGRIHNLDDFMNTYSLARKVGFKNINVDFMIGLPKQTIADIDEMLELINKIEPEHVSVYSLIVEKGTKLYTQINDGSLILPSEDEERKMYWRVKKGLEELGFEHYEISNFAKKGFYSRHNMDYWNQKEYIGVGSGAHSYTDNVRYSNIDNIEEYIENYKKSKQEDNIIFHEKQNVDSKMKEYMILGFRKIKGIEFQEFKNKFGIDLRDVYKNEIAKLKKYELIETNESSIFLSDKGIDLANIVWEEFV